MSLSYKELLGIDGEPLEFEWNVLPQFSSLQILQKIQDDCENGTSNLRNSQTGSSSCQCSTTSIGKEKETMEFVFRIQKKSRITRQDSCKDIGCSSVLETKRSGMELFFTHLKENGTLEPPK